MRIWSSTPAGILTVSVRRVRTRPSPAQVGHGLVITVPYPPQLLHGRGTRSHPAARGERVAAEIHDLAFLVVGEHLVGRGDLLEPVVRARVGVDVRMVLACELAVGPLDVLGGGVAGYTENAVVVLGHCVMPS